MTVLPLIGRELQVQARRKAIYWLRFAIGLVTMMVCLPALLSQASTEVGRTIFDALSVSAFLLCCAGCLLTSDSLGAEIREGTLPLLMLTRVRLVDLVAGKLAAQALPAFMALATMLPLLMVPLLSGGVTAGEAFRKGLALLGTLFVCLAVGLYSSTSTRERGPAIRRSTGWLVVIMLVPVLINVLPHSSVTIGLASPIWTMIMAGDARFGASPTPFWVSLTLTQLIGLGFFFRTCVALRSRIRGEAAPVAERPAVSRRRRWHGIGITPALWVASGQRHLKPMLWVSVWLVIIYNFGFSVFMPWLFGAGLGLFVRWIPHFTFSFASATLLAWAASRALIEGRRSGEFELLTTTPLGVSSLVEAHWRFLKKALWGPILLLGVAMLWPQISLWRRFPPTHELGFLTLSMFYVPRFISAVLSMVAVCQVGVWFGVTAPTAGRAILSTVLVVKAVPYMISFLATLLPYFRSISMGPIALVPTLLSIGYYIWIIRRTREKVRQLRTIGRLAG